MKIHLVRHGLAGDPDAWGGPDDSRPLTAKGRRKFRETARAFARVGERIDLPLSGVDPARIDFPKGAIVRIDADDPAARKAQPRWWLDAGDKKPREGLPLK